MVIKIAQNSCTKLKTSKNQNTVDYTVENFNYYHANYCGLCLVSYALKFFVKKISSHHSSVYIQEHVNAAHLYIPKYSRSDFSRWTQSNILLLPMFSMFFFFFLNKAKAAVYDSFYSQFVYYALLPRLYRFSGSTAENIASEKRIAERNRRRSFNSSDDESVVLHTMYLLTRRRTCSIRFYCIYTHVIRTCIYIYI